MRAVAGAGGVRRRAIQRHGQDNDAGLIEIDPGWEGAAKLPDGLDATLSVEAFSAGEAGEIQELALTGAMDSGYLRFVTVPDDQLDWSACGTDINLRVNTSLRTRGTEDAEVSLNALIIYPLATKAC